MRLTHDGHLLAASGDLNSGNESRTAAPILRITFVSRQDAYDKYLYIQGMIAWNRLKLCNMKQWYKFEGGRGKGPITGPKHANALP